MPASAPALAVIDGTLYHLTRQGGQAERYGPIATAVIEFRRGPMCIYVREHPYGFLPGIPNLYCLDAALRLLWMAEWPDHAHSCSRILDVSDHTLTVESASGAIVRLDAHTGRLRGVERPMAATA